MESVLQAKRVPTFKLYLKVVVCLFISLFCFLEKSEYLENGQMAAWIQPPVAQLLLFWEPQSLPRSLAPTASLTHVASLPLRCECATAACK